MNHLWKRILASIGFAAAGLCLAGSAHAGCADDALGTLTPTMHKQSWESAPGVRTMHVDWRPRHEDDDIVGLWNIVVTLKDGTIGDHGLQHWHSDGTEYLNSENHNPASQNYCMGIWERTGSNTYKTNHFAFSYAAGAGQPTNIVRIRSEVTLSRDGNQMYGEETTDVFTADGKNLIVSITGALIGKRVMMDTPAKDIR
jgi:hypothetical protein